MSTGGQNMEILPKCKKRRKKTFFLERLRVIPKIKNNFSHRRQLQEKPSPLEALSLLSVSIKGFNDDHGHFLQEIIIPIRQRCGDSTCFVPQHKLMVFCFLFCLVFCLVSLLRDKNKSYD
jgi:hypothetical protein